MFEIPIGGWWSMQRELWGHVSDLLGGQAKDDYESVFGALDEIGEAHGWPKTTWRPLAPGANIF